MADKKLSRKEAKKLAAQATVEFSDNHMCFAGFRGEGQNRVFRSVDPDDLEREEDVEYFVCPNGCCLYRSPIDTPLVKLKKDRDLKGMTVRLDRMCLQTGIILIQDACTRYGCPVPIATIKLRDRYEKIFNMMNNKRRASGHGTGAKPKAGSRSMKGKNGLTLGENWSELFAANEKLAKKGKALTDGKLKKEMYRQFPNKKGVTTIERVSMMRSIYNKGTSVFAKAGAAGSRGRPTSFRYDDGKTAIAGRGSGKRTATKAKKKTAPKKSAKKSAKGRKAAAKKTTSLKAAKKARKKAAKK